MEKIPGISQSEIQRVLDDFEKEDEFLAAQRKLNTEHKRTVFIKEKFIYVSPKEIVLNPRKVKEENAPKALYSHSGNI